MKRLAHVVLLASALSSCNRAADATQMRAADGAVTAAGWLVVRVWECETRADINAAAQRVEDAVQAVSAGVLTAI